MPACFVVMGFGEKTDLATGRKLNLDATYNNVIKPAVTDAGYSCTRADEIRHSGMIDVPMYDMLFDAELVIADLSTANLNAIFELGVRHAFKPRSTIILAEKQFTSPFDVNHIVIHKYEHLGSDIGFGEVMRMRQELKDLIGAIAGNPKPDSPCYTLLEINPPSRRSKGLGMGAVGAPKSAVPAQESYAAWLQKASDAKARSDFIQAETILKEIYDAQTSSGDSEKTARPRIVQELALATYKAGEQRAKQEGPQVALDGYTRSIELLRQLDPERTTDPETLGLWSAVHKRLAESDQRSDVHRKVDLDTAITAAQRGCLIRQDYYTGINYAYLLDYRASRSTGDDRIADRVQADRVRRSVVDMARGQAAMLKAQFGSQEGSAQSDAHKDELYWTLASVAEALTALGDPQAPEALEEARRHARAQWMFDTTANQIERVKKLRA
jgi:hypothetical protein